MTTHIIIADDHPLFRAALKQAVQQAVSDATVLEAESISTLQKLVEQHNDVDLILLDLNMPGAHGFSGLVFLRGQFPAVPVVVVSGMDNPQVVPQSLDYGASGFIPKSAPLSTLVTAIQQILEGEVWVPEGTQLRASRQAVQNSFSERLAELTPQQFRVLSMLCEGLLNKQIAYELEVSEATIKAHITALFRKLGVRNRTQAVIAMQQLDVGQASVEIDAADED
ncbi:MAG: response regulator transcription factor [Hahellaceae bacterium]|nr:response regulator transcription factor [Hahellaceae bacterium]